MQQEIRFATFNVCNLALPGMQFYANLAPYTPQEYDAKTTWMAQQLDFLDADVIGFQEIFSQTALRDVLAKTQKYRQAHHAGFEPDPQASQLTPSVALVSRLPFAMPPVIHTDFPHRLSIVLPEVKDPLTRFTRPILQAQVAAPNGVTIDAFVAHLKSKRPDYRNGEHDDDLYQYGLATLRSLLRRGAEALALRYVLTDFAGSRRLPLVVMGDFNDVASSVTTQLVAGVGRHGVNDFENRLFDSYRIQAMRNMSRDVAFTHVHDGTYDTVDHILVSEQLNQASPFAIGEVTEVLYRNDHVTFRVPEASDHGLVMARITLYDTADAAAATPPMPTP